MCSPDKLGIQLLFIPEEYGGMGGGTFDVYLHLRTDGADRSRRRHGGAGYVPGKRSDHLRRDTGAEEDLAGAHRRRRVAVRLRRHRAGCRQRSGCAADHRGPRRRGRQHRRLQDQREQAVDQQRRHRRRLHHPGQHARRPELVHRGSGRARASRKTSPKTSTASASATRRHSRSTMSMSMPTGWSAASKARD